MKAQLIQLQQSTLQKQYQTAKNNGWETPYNHLYFDTFTFLEYQGLYDIRYHGNSLDESYAFPDFEEEEDYEYTLFGKLLQLIVENPEKIRTLYFSSPDEGANGLIEWDFRRLAYNSVVFENLLEFYVQPNEMGNNNTAIIGQLDLDSNETTLSKLLAKMPNLCRLTLPDIPAKSFFSIPFTQLKELRVQATWEHRYFIKNLADWTLLEQVSIDFTDTIFMEDTESINPSNITAHVDFDILKEFGFDEDSIQELKNTVENEPLSEIKIPEFPETYGKPTAFEDYLKLFKSKNISPSWHFKLRENQLTQAQLFELQSLNKQVQFLHIPTSKEEYVSHMMQKQERTEK